MRLIDLKPKLYGRGGEGITDAAGNPVPQRFGIGVIMNCPCGQCGQKLSIPFKNPMDGGAADDSERRSEGYRTSTARAAGTDLSVTD